MRLSAWLIPFWLAATACSQAAPPPLRAIGADAEQATFIVPTERLPPAARAFLQQNWSVAADPDHPPIPAEPVQDFVRDVFGPMWASNRICASSPGSHARFMSIDGNTEQLAVSIDDSGRFCNLLAILGKTPDGVAVSRLDVWQLDDLTDIAYPQGDATLLAVRQLWSGYGASANCTAVWPVVYAFRDGVFVDKSAAAPAFYKAELARLVASKAYRDGSNPDYLCLRMEAARIRHVLNPRDERELAMGLALARSADPDRQGKAVLLLGDAGGAFARAELARLSNESDRGVARAVSELLPRLP